MAAARQATLHEAEVRAHARRRWLTMHVHALARTHYDGVGQLGRPGAVTAAKLIVAQDA